MADSKVEQSATKHKPDGLGAKFKTYVKSLGPGLVTGASDDDPSGIGTYSQTGAKFAYTQLWTALFTFPLMAGVQEICARIGLQTRGGLAELIREYYPKPVLYFCVALLCIANTINLGADLGAMAASGKLLVGIPFVGWLIVITLISVALQVFMDYKRYAQILRILALTVLIYVLVPFVSPTDWPQALRSTILPSLQFNKDYVLNLVAILGTTISPYLFFWQTNQEVEEKIQEGKTAPRRRARLSKAELRWMRSDVVSGMLLSNIVAWFIIATIASTLYVHNIKNIDNVTQVAEALRPVAGDFAYLFFAAGIIGTGLLAVPVLAGSTAYAVAETFKLREGLYLKLRQAPGFYAVIILAMLLGFGMNLIGIDPIQALYYSSVLNGIVAPPLLVIIMLIGNNRKIMGDKVNGRVSNILGWITTVVMSLAAIALLVSLFLP